ncbi:uroporphyrinogen-III synthase [Aureisphaera sp. CAU 1614]|uniref:Uroporphyrinogen-III synthase n=1 Tax=Halomarinibacterium sedimenti TaxID=2857106 RepID=A0A9X1JUS6_9FLAO|nr:uroporphyrinogen-III synthase [Halomarinibacterium sedimenti]
MTKTQKELFNDSGMDVLDYDAISIEFLDFDAPQFVKNGIFTSQNAARSVLGKNIQISNAFCVGEKTKQLLEENGQNVVKMSEYASELAIFIQNNYQNEEFYFFCGNRRKEEIPYSFKNLKNTLFELKTYKSELNSMKFDQKWDGILFFSPSGVQSFTTKNSLGTTPVFCVGNTTAEEAKLHIKSPIYIADDTTIESVIKKAINTLNND